MKVDLKTNILIVDDKPENLLVIESILDQPDIEIIKANSGQQALGLMLDYDFAAVLLDVQMPEMDGFEAAELMRGSEKTKNVPIIFITAISKEQKSIFKGYNLGAVDYLFKPLEPAILKSKVNVFINLYQQKMQLEIQAAELEKKINELLELKETNWKLENMSMIDALTGVSNRRFFDRQISAHWQNAIRNSDEISLVYIDIDNFKAYNDGYGHLKGDECLKKVALTLKKSLKRHIDIIARYGGEEFALILPFTNKAGAITVAQRLLKNISELRLEHEFSKVNNFVSISIGVNSIKPMETDILDDFINEADKAMYKAKMNGKNRIEIAWVDMV